MDLPSEWADNPEHFLRFLCLSPLERPLSREQMAELDDMPEGRVISPEEHEWDELEQMILDMGFVPIENHEAQQ